MATETGKPPDRREAALAHVSSLQALLRKEPARPQVAELIDLAEHLERAVRSFHMEAIRFRMFSLDRGLKAAGLAESITEAFEAVRHDLEAAGFHTRSHA